jgi:hypothetical protein
LHARRLDTNLNVAPEKKLVNSFQYAVYFTSADEIKSS